jgi:eukaryotic-like serine/threonine-protein kinase
MATASSPPILGSVLTHRWRVVQKLGEGPMGEVFAAEPVAGGARVAVKILRSQFRGDAAVVAEFADWGRTCARLIHPNIVRVFECDAAEDGAPYVVMEALEGVPLGAYTRNGGRVPTMHAVAIAQGVLAGLAAAHTQGIVHGDLKPDNVCLTREPGGTFLVKVLDFGLAKVMEAARGMGNRSKMGPLLGAPAYMSPEQLKNAGDLDQRTDLFSVGVILYEMLTGRVAFPAPTEYARIAAVLATEPEPMERVDPALAELAPLVARALRKDRDQRFGSALEMARALGAMTSRISASAAGAPGPAESPSPGQLSRLPQVTSMLATSASSFVPQSLLGETDPAPPAETAPMQMAGRRKPSGTLASVEAPNATAEPVPQIVVAPIGGTLPSKDLPRIVTGRERDARRVRPGLVVALVALALAAGFLLGWAFGRAR